MLINQICTIKSVLSDHSKIDKTKVLMANGSFMKVESIEKCTPWSILQYFWPALRDDRYLKPILVFSLIGCIIFMIFLVILSYLFLAALWSPACYENSVDPDQLTFNRFLWLYLHWIKIIWGVCMIRCNLDILKTICYQHVKLWKQFVVSM